MGPLEAVQIRTRFDTSSGVCAVCAQRDGGWGRGSPVVIEEKRWRMHAVRPGARTGAGREDSVLLESVGGEFPAEEPLF